MIKSIVFKEAAELVLKGNWTRRPSRYQTCAYIALYDAFLEHEDTMMDLDDYLDLFTLFIKQDVPQGISIISTIWHWNDAPGMSAGYVSYILSAAAREVNRIKEG